MEAEHPPWLHTSFEPPQKSEPLERRAPGLPRRREIIEQTRAIAAQKSWEDLLDRVQTFLLRYVGSGWQGGSDRG